MTDRSVHTMGHTDGETTELRLEMSKLLKFFETQYKHDLAVHLYSTHLLHRMNPDFPHRRWSSWPKSVDAVPVPKEKYVDEPNEMDGSVPPSTLDYEEEEEEETRPDAEECMRLEIDRLFKRRVHKSIHHGDHNASVRERPSVDIEKLVTPDRVMDAVMEKLESALNNFGAVNRRSEKVSVSAYDWASVLTAADVKDEEFLKKRKKLFEEDADEYLRAVNRQIEREVISESSEDEDDEAADNEDDSPEPKRMKPDPLNPTFSAFDRAKQKRILNHVLSLRKQTTRLLLDHKIRKVHNETMYERKDSLKLVIAHNSKYRGIGKYNPFTHH